MKHLLITTAKLGLAGASIAAIAALFLVTTPSADQAVQGAQADIIDVFPRSARSDTAFSQLMQDEGIPARPFDYNGNVVFFGAKSTPNTTPRRDLLHLQQKFVERGINEEVHLKSINDQGVLHHFDEEYVEALGMLKEDPEHPSPVLSKVSDEELDRQGKLASLTLNGEIMPVLTSEDYISMSGIVPKDRSTKVSYLTLRDTWQRNDQGYVDVAENSQGFRFIDLTREDDGTMTTTATWADKDFDARKIQPGYDGPGSSVDTTVSPCIGCSRTFRIEGLNKDNDPFTTNQYSSQSRPEELEIFYNQSMAMKGWKSAEARKPMNELFEKMPHLQQGETQVMLFEKDDKHLNIFLTDLGMETSVTTLLEEKSLDQHEQ